MRAANFAPTRLGATPERRVSLRTDTSVEVVVRRGRRAVRGRAVDLSQSGILVEHRALPRTTTERPMELELELPGGSTRLVARRVRQTGRHSAYAFVDAADRDRLLLTDYLFCRLLEDLQTEDRSGVRHAVPKRRTRSRQRA